LLLQQEIIKKQYSYSSAISLGGLSPAEPTDHTAMQRRGAHTDIQKLDALEGLTGSESSLDQKMTKHNF